MVVLLVVLVLIFFIFSRGGRERTDIEVNLPDTRATEVEVRERIEIDLPEKIDVNIGTGEKKPAQPPPQPPAQSPPPP